MKLDGIQSFEERKYIKFKGNRELRNVVEQLAKNNSYSLTEPNQRYITESITKLGKVKGTKNIQFLLDTAAKSTYSTNITLKKAPKNNWKSLLLAAATAAIAITPFISGSIKAKLAKIAAPTKLNQTEQEILKLREQLLGLVDLEQIKNETIGSIKNFEKNLDYFIISSETTLEHKKYVLEKIKFLMSNEYDINPQLADKKSLVAAEIINDIAIDTEDEEAPNIKAVNQKQHGMCAAISIARKKLVYEDKPKYIDMILTELDSKDYLEVYDRSVLGQGIKCKVPKIFVDFDTAIANGYRILDASTMHWMQVATTSGASNLSFSRYTPFDKENFDVYEDTFFNAPLQDKTLAKKQKFYQSLKKAKSLIEDYKAQKIKYSLKQEEKMLASRKDLETLSEICTKIRENISKISNDFTNEEIQSLSRDLIKLCYKYSDRIPTGNEYAYLPNEESSSKKEKIKNFLLSNDKIEYLDNTILESIFTLIEYYNEIDNKNSMNKTKSSHIKRAKELYEIGAAFRNQVVIGLENQNILDNIIRGEGLPTYEEMIFNTIDSMIEEVKIDSEIAPLIYNKLAFLAVDENSDINELTAEDMVEVLEALKEFLQNIISSDIDNLYYQMGTTTRKESMLNAIGRAIEETFDANKKTLNNYIDTFHSKKTRKAIAWKMYDAYKKLENGNEEDFLEIFKTTGQVSQIEHLKSVRDKFISSLQQQDRDTLINFLEANELNPEDGDEVNRVLNDVLLQVDSIENYFKKYTEILRIVDDEGNILMSADPKEYVLLHLEKKGRITPAHKLKELQEHFTKIQKDRSSDEFNSRQGKLKDKTLYHFSGSEKETLDEIERDINKMQGHIERQLLDVRKEILPILEEMNRNIGINNGQFWVSEGHSGLYSEQEVRLLEYLTDRPHYISEDIEKSIEKIKTGTYSGITSSSVFHDKPGFHAQYVADIEPVEIKVLDNSGNIKTEKRDILFQDNTWGASESENTWVDSNGLIRTDYSDYRGGSLGYITNKKFRNGNFIDRITGEMILEHQIEDVRSRVYKRLRHTKNDESWKMPQYSDVILDGISPLAKSLTDTIYDSIFIPNVAFVSKLVKNIRNFSSEILKELDARIAKEIEEYGDSQLKDIDRQQYLREQVLAMITNIKLAGESWEITYNELYKRINPPFGKGIETKEMFDNLPDNDYLKVILEKIAIIKSGYTSDFMEEFANASTMQELNILKTKQKEQALEEFKFAFGKLNPEYLVDYLANSFALKQDDDIRKIIEKHKLNLSEDEIALIADDFSIILNDLDGSTRKTINTLMDKLGNDIDNIIKDPAAAWEIKNYIKDYLNEYSYFNENDLKDKRLQHIINFIDREFNPYDDEKLIKIYRQIQDMTLVEFEEEILPRIRPEDLNLKPISGYDIFKKLRRGEDNADRDLINILYQDTLYTDVSFPVSKPRFTPQKLVRQKNYEPKDDFNSIYHMMSGDLYMLKFPKLFNEYKDRNYRKHGVYPAYPHINVISDRFIDVISTPLFDKIERDVPTIKYMSQQIETYQISNELKGFLEKKSPEETLSEEEFNKVTELLGRFVTYCKRDDDLKNEVAIALELLEYPLGSNWSNYINGLKIITDRISLAEKTTSAEILLEYIEEKRKSLKLNITTYVKSFIDARYEDDIQSTINQYISLLTKENLIKASETKDLIKKEFKKKHIINNRENLLEKFILSFVEDPNNEKDNQNPSKDAWKRAFQEAYTTNLYRALNYAKSAEIQYYLMNAIKNGNAFHAREFFKNFLVTEQDYEVPMPMDSGRILSQMVENIMLDDSEETAYMFIEKLGLGENYVGFMVNDFDFEEIKQLIDRSFETAENSTRFKKELEPLIKKASAALSRKPAGASIILQELTEKTTELANKYTIHEHFYNIVLDTYYGLERYFKENDKEIDRGLVLKSAIDSSVDEMFISISDYLKETDLILEKHTKTINFINRIILNTSSQAHQDRIKMNEKFDELCKYSSKRRELQAQQNSDKI